jgi:hypothetical protein
MATETLGVWEGVLETRPIESKDLLFNRFPFQLDLVQRFHEVGERGPLGLIVQGNEMAPEDTVTSIFGGDDDFHELVLRVQISDIAERPEAFRDGDFSNLQGSRRLS